MEPFRIMVSRTNPQAPVGVKERERATPVQIEAHHGDRFPTGDRRTEGRDYPRGSASPCPTFMTGHGRTLTVDPQETTKPVLTSRYTEISAACRTLTPSQPSRPPSDGIGHCRTTLEGPQ
ncbi:hypothetical protein Pme01_50830 [Planosporangium mesophilum]|uniref:Uncharacterized protein n=1 Tax=Planosporangium mesophilum TaxID=689768 RepID=A0A8J3TH39_9ACTN|nr:hypothetical protein Pme01_50830 [Planosporangium mesophilum]